MSKFEESKFAVETANGVATVKYDDENAFYEGTELSKKTIKEVFDHASNYIQEATVAASEQATKIMTDDKSVEKVVVEYPYGVSKRGNVTVAANRAQTFRNPTDGSEVTKSTLKVAVADPLTKVSKTKVRELTAKMTESLLS